MGWLGRIFGRTRDPETAPAGLPPELLASITAAGVIWRPGAEEGDPARAVVTVRTLGRFYWDGPTDAAAHIRRAYPDLTGPEARRAALLLGDVIASRNRVAARGFSTRPVPWALRW